MDYDKLIEQLNAWNEQHLSVVCGSKHFACDYLCENEDCIVVRAATALSTLQAENEKLRSEAEGMRSNWYKSVEKIQKLRAELEQVKRERDAAVKDMEALMWFSGEGCHICAHEIIIHREPYVRSECALGNAAVCCPTWRGPQKED